MNQQNVIFCVIFFVYLVADKNILHEWDSIGVLLTHDLSIF